MLPHGGSGGASSTREPAFGDVHAFLINRGGEGADARRLLQILDVGDHLEKPMRRRVPASRAHIWVWVTGSASRARMRHMLACTPLAHHTAGGARLYKRRGGCVRSLHI